MKRFVAGADRGQWTLLPECFDVAGREVHARRGRRPNDPPRSMITDALILLAMLLAAALIIGWLVR